MSFEKMGLKENRYVALIEVEKGKLNNKIE